MKTSPIFASFVALLLCNAVRAEDAPPASQPAIIATGDKAALTSQMDKDAVVEGTVSDAQWSTSGAVFLIKFKDGDTTQFQGAIFSKNKEAMEKAFKGDLSAALEGAKIQIKGKLQVYREHPEIIIDNAEQITILVKGSGVSSHPAVAAKPRISGPYAQLKLTDEQLTKVAAIQGETRTMELELEKKLRADESKKIEGILTEDENKQLNEIQKQTRVAPSVDKN